jgi:hypothetical protein
MQACEWTLEELRHRLAAELICDPDDSFDERMIVNGAWTEASYDVWCAAVAQSGFYLDERCLPVRIDGTAVQQVQLPQLPSCLRPNPNLSLSPNPTRRLLDAQVLARILGVPIVVHDSQGARPPLTYGPTDPTSGAYPSSSLSTHAMLFHRQ